MEITLILMGFAVVIIYLHELRSELKEIKSIVYMTDDDKTRAINK